MPYINAIGTATPGNPISQQQISGFMSKAHKMTVNGEKVRLEALYRASGISTRYSVIEDYSKTSNFDFFPDSDDLEPFPTVKSRMQIYNIHALKLSSEAARKAISEIDLSVDTITHVLTVSCTGMQAPGLDIQLVEELGLPHTVHRTAINYMGCYAAMNALKVAKDICISNPNAKVLIACVELCSIHFQKESSEDNLLANALFGDGAAVVLVSNEQSGNSVSLDHFRSQIYPMGKTDMAWNIGNTGFEMKLTSYVPDIIKVGLDQHLQDLKAESGVEHIDDYAIHPGGKRILDVFREQLNLTREDLESSYRVLRDFGNMSSVTILFVVKDLLSRELQGPRTILAMAFGPGLTVESAILTTGDA